MEHNLLVDQMLPRAMRMICLKALIESVAGMTTAQPE